MRYLLIILLFGCSKTEGQIAGFTGVPAPSFTEYKTYYRGEVYTGKDVNYSDNASTDITDYMPVSPSESVTAYTSDNTAATLYGKLYDANRAEIQTIGSLTAASTLTFTTPANAKYFILYTRYGGVDFRSKLKVRSTSMVTYPIPITPINNTLAALQAALDFQQFFTKPVEVSGTFSLPTALIINSGNRIVCNDAFFQLAGHDNIIRNEAIKDAANDGFVFRRGNKNISITGTWTIKGADYANWQFDPANTSYDLWRKIGMLFGNVDSFRIEGVKVLGTNGWGMCFEQSRYGVFNNIRFEQGGETRNQDGMDFRQGSHHMTITNVSGWTHDDMIALTNIRGYPNVDVFKGIIQEPGVTRLDIHDFSISNIDRVRMNEFMIDDNTTYTPRLYGSGILLLTEDGLQIHDVTIDDVTGESNILIQLTMFDYSTYSDATVNDFYNVNISNTGAAAIYIQRPIKNSSFIEVAAMDYTNTYNSVVFQSGSLNVSRKYVGQNLETFPTVN